MNKKGQVGETLTWFVAFIIIFFIMFLFFFSSMFISSETRGFEAKQSKDNLALTKTISAFMKSGNFSSQDFWKNLELTAEKSQRYYINLSEIKFVREIR